MHLLPKVLPPPQIIIENNLYSYTFACCFAEHIAVSIVICMLPAQCKHSVEPSGKSHIDLCLCNMCHSSIHGQFTCLRWT